MARCVHLHCAGQNVDLVDPLVIYDGDLNKLITRRHPAGTLSLYRSRAVYRHEDPTYLTGAIENLHKNKKKYSFLTAHRTCGFDVIRTYNVSLCDKR